MDPIRSANGQKLYKQWACGNCHGRDRRGTELGPSLTNVSDHWTEESLAAFLVDRKSVPASPHLEELSKKYSGAGMPEYHHPEEERRALAFWLLTSS